MWFIILINIVPDSIILASWCKKPCVVPYSHLKRKVQCVWGQLWYIIFSSFLIGSAMCPIFVKPVPSGWCVIMLCDLTFTKTFHNIYSPDLSRQEACALWVCTVSSSGLSTVIFLNVLHNSRACPGHLLLFLFFFKNSFLNFIKWHISWHNFLKLTAYLL